MTLMDPAERSARGITTATEVTGRDLPMPSTPIEQSWRDFIYAEVWSRPGLDRRARFLIAIAGAASGNGPTSIIDDYVRGALTGGELTLAELREVALHHAVYTGWSRGMEIDVAVTRVAAELALAPVATPPIRASPWDANERVTQGQAEFERTMGFGGPPPTTPYFAAGINNFVFAEMWSRPGLDQRARRWVTLVGVAESCAMTPIKTHFYAALSSGNCQPDELQEFVLQYGVHAGWPKASVIQGAVSEMIRNYSEGKAWSG